MWKRPVTGAARDTIGFGEKLTLSITRRSGSETRATAIDVAGGLGAPTTAVALLNTDVDPCVFRAVTSTRISWPTSPAVSVYAFTWEWTMNVEQLFPVPSHRCHEKSKWIGCVPDQSPRSTVSVAPCCGVPDRDGRRVATGA